MCSSAAAKPGCSQVTGCFLHLWLLLSGYSCACGMWAMLTTWETFILNVFLHHRGNTLLIRQMRLVWGNSFPGTSNVNTDSWCLPACLTACHIMDRLNLADQGGLGKTHVQCRLIPFDYDKSGNKMQMYCTLLYLNVYINFIFFWIKSNSEVTNY